MKKAIGFLFLIAVIVVVAVLALSQKKSASNSSPAPGQAITLKGLVGGEKLALLNDPQVLDFLRKKYGITLDVSRRGSLEMAREDVGSDVDFLWPSSQLALELYKEKGGPMKAAEIVFNSPMVLYSWEPVTEALVQAGVVGKQGSVYYVTNLQKLLSMTESGTAWKSIGLTDLYGKVNIYSTDPTQSNSGNMFAALLANEINGGEVATESSLPTILPQLKAFFERQGFMEQSSDVIFRQFLSRGMGDKPIIVGYEAQLLGYRTEEPGGFAQAAKSVRTLYPKPTIWSSHPLIARTDQARRLIDAMKDPEFQKIAWERHGFRSDTSGAAIYAELGVPERIDNVMPTPSAKVMRKILAALG